MIKANISGSLDLMSLKSDVSISEIKELCKKAVTGNYASVCIPPVYCREASYVIQSLGYIYLKEKEELPKICAAIGYPTGYESAGAKSNDIELIRDFVDEVEIVINQTLLRNGYFYYLTQELGLLSAHAKLFGKTVRMAFDANNFTETEKRIVCKMCMDIPDIDYISLSTGHENEEYDLNDMLDDVKMLKSMINASESALKIKVCCGHCSPETLHNLILAGAERVSIAPNE